MPYEFDKIARTYDRLNRVMTLGLDRRWRRYAAHAVCRDAACCVSILDVACGTGDMILSLMQTRHAASLQVTGVDLSEEMMSIARAKAPATYMTGDAEHLPFEDGTFDAVTCAFGVRNFVHLELGLSEMLRVLKPGGRMVILELATPDSPLIRPFYNLYTKHILPWLGSRIAGNREAYTYLPESIAHFPKGDAFLKILNSQISILNCRHQRLTFGVCRMYTVEK